MVGHRASQFLTRLLHRLKPAHFLLAPLPDGPGRKVPASVMCCIENAGASSMSALQFAARTASRRRDRGRADLVVVLVCPSPLVLMSDPVLCSDWLGAGADVEAMANEVAAQFRLTPRLHEIAGWSRVDIVRIARERVSDVVILPMMDDGAGPVTRWTRRDLVSALVERTQALVMDEYDRSFAAPPVKSS
jgi:hypothetical protein